MTPCADGKCSAWKAVHDHRSKPGPTLHVTGECEFPRLGYQVELKRATPQGTNPTILILERVVTPPVEGSGSAFETVKVEYSEQTDIEYTQVTIVPDNVTVDVQDLQSASPPDAEYEAIPAPGVSGAQVRTTGGACTTTAPDGVARGPRCNRLRQEALRHA